MLPELCRNTPQLWGFFMRIITFADGVCTGINPGAGAARRQHRARGSRESRIIAARQTPPYSRNLPLLYFPDSLSYRGLPGFPGFPMLPMFISIPGAGSESSTRRLSHRRFRAQDSRDYQSGLGTSFRHGTIIGPHNLSASSKGRIGDGPHC